MSGVNAGTLAPGSPTIISPAISGLSSLAETPRSPVDHAAAVRLKLRDAGYFPIPLVGKRPVLEGWQKQTDTGPEDFASWSRNFPSATNTGVLTARMPTFDGDILNPEAAAAVETLVRDRFGDCGTFLVRFGKTPKRAIPFQTEKPFPKIACDLVGRDGKAGQKIELLCDGQQLVVDGIHPDTKKPYTWFGGEPGDVRLDELPCINEAEARHLVRDAVELLVAEHGYTIKASGNDEPKKEAKSDPMHPLALELARKLWGEATSRTGNEYRFGTHGSKAMDSRTGAWFDFENDAGGGLGDLVRLAGSDGTARAAETVRPSVVASPFKWIDPAQIPKRQWLYRPHYIRQFLSLLFSSGGKGKSSLLIAEALAMVSGRPLLGVKSEKPLRVWYWNGEDPKLELQRRFAATAKHYGLKPEDIGERLFIDSGRTLPMVIAEEEKYGTHIIEPVIKEVIATLLDNKIDVLIIDPFVSCHRVSENDNSAIECVAKSWSRVAEEANCSIMAAHHNRKTGGETATVDDGRGASALRDAARTARAINTMTTREAANAGIPEPERGYYFRADIGKANLTAPAERADWFWLESVQLENAEGDWDVGDSVGVVTAWNYPVARTPNVTEAIIRAALDAIRAGGPWRADQRSTNELWVGIPVAQALGVDLRDRANLRIVARTVEDWLRTGLLRRIDRQDRRRQTRSYVEVGETGAVDEPQESKGQTAAVDEPQRDAKDQKQQEEPCLFTFAAVE